MKPIPIDPFLAAMAMLVAGIAPATAIAQAEYPSKPDEFSALIRREIPKWRKVVKESGAKVG